MDRDLQAKRLAALVEVLLGLWDSLDQHLILTE
jgi:hypothetical protein